MEVAVTLGLALALGVCSVIDLREFRLPDWLTLPLIIAGLLMNAFSGMAAVAWSLAGAAIGFLSLYAVARVYLHARGQHGLGLGDAKLLAAAGSWLGPAYLAPVVLVAAVLALGAAVLLRIDGRAMSWQSTLPFGPFICAGFLGFWCAKLAGWSF